MRNTSLIAASLLAGGLSALPANPSLAQAPTAQSQPAYATYDAALQAAEKLFTDKKYRESRTAFETAHGLAKTGLERAAALMGVARTHEKELVIREVRSGKSPVRRESYTDFEAARRKYGEVEKLDDLSLEKKAEAQVASVNTYALEGAKITAREAYSKLIAAGLPPAALAMALVGRAETYLNGVFLTPGDASLAMSDFERALKVEGIRDPQKADALLRLAELYFRTLNKEQVPINLAAVVALPGASGAQKARAYMMSGNLHHMNKDLEKARAAWSQIPLLSGVEADQKVLAHRNLAQTYFAEKKIEQGQAELEKAAQVPALTVFEKAALYEEMGDVHLAVGGFAAARAAFERIIALPDAGKQRHNDALLKTGQSYSREKNLVAARETWERLTAGKDTGAVEALRLIGVSHAEEKNYPAARAAFERWLAIPIDSYWKEDAWLLMGQTYEREANWSAARDAFQKLVSEPKARNTRRVHAVLGIGRTYQAEKNPDAVLQAYASLPAAFKVTGQLSPAEMSELNQMRTALTEQLSKLATSQGKQKEKVPTAVALFRIAEQINDPDYLKANIQLALGDLFYSHGMLAEAKAEYLKVSARAFPNQQQQAQQKLKEIAEKETANAGS